MKEGDLMTAKDKTKKQHFIPRVYLRSFTNKSNVNNLVVVRHQCEYMAMNQ